MGDLGRNRHRHVVSRPSLKVRLPSFIELLCPHWKENPLPPQMEALPHHVHI